MISIQIEGQKELARTFAELGKATKSKIGLRALVTALTPILDGARSRVKVDTGNLRDSLGFKVVKFRSGNMSAIIGPRKGFRKDGRLAHKYGHLVEFGHFTRKPSGVSVKTKTGKTKRESGGSQKFVPAKPFLRPAFESGKHRAAKDIARVIGTEVQIAAKRLARRKARTAT